ncbi:cysteine desulfurase [bacterium]|nr:cysteine desulfurase [bacterium]MBU1917142.1 cysteine desulfurase [bacterium]
MIYLDYNATTPIDSRVLEVMGPYLTEIFGNPSSKTHAFGWDSEKAVTKARETIAHYIGAQDSKSIIFTAGTTESNNMVLKGVFYSATKKPAHIITQKTEHGSILATCEFLETLGAEITYLDVDEYGLVSPDALKSSIKENTVLVSIMTANNEIGTVQPIKELAAVTHEFDGVLFHTDAAQSIGKMPTHVVDDAIDLYSFTAHKIYGPKGVGGLYMSPKARSKMVPLIHGGGHEFGLRSGTHNVAGIVGLAKSIEICCSEIEAEAFQHIKLRDYIIKEIMEKVDHVTLNGHPTQRLPSNVNLSIRFISSADLIAALPHIAFSTSSACSSNSAKPSYVIMMLAGDEERAKSSIRLSVGRFTSQEEVAKATADIIVAIKSLREKSLEYEMFKKQK